MLVKQKHLPSRVLHIYTFSSQSCASIFRNTRALSGIYSSIVNFTVHDFLRCAQRLSLLNDIKCKQTNDEAVNKLAFPVHYKHRNDRQSSRIESQTEIDQIDIEQIITEAYNKAVDILEGLEILNVLKNKRVLGLKPLSEHVFKQLSFHSKMYDYSSQLNEMDDEDETPGDVDGDDDNSSSNDDYTDGDENIDTQEPIHTTKNDFTGMKVFTKIESHMKHSYFEMTLNDHTKFMHKQTACWLLTGEKSKLSNDRLLRVQQTNKTKNKCFFLSNILFYYLFK